MSIKRIVLHVEDSSSGDERLAASLFVAHKAGAAITGVHAVRRPEVPGYVGVNLPEGLLAANWQRTLDEAGALGERFLKRCGDARVEAEWQLLEGHTYSVLAREGRCADVIVVGQPHANSTHVGEDAMVESLILAAGRPVLVMPRGHEQMGLGAHVALAWNGGRECARALADGLPWLQHAATVDIVVVDHGEGASIGRGADRGAAQVQRRLAQDGIEARLQRIDASPGRAGQALLDWLAGGSVSLLIMGAYGRSRLRELVLGGATAQMLAESTTPLLMSH